MRRRTSEEDDSIIVKYSNELNLLTFPKLSLTQKKMVQLILAFTRENEENYQSKNFLAKFFNKQTRTIEIPFAKFWKLINGDELKIKAWDLGIIINDMLNKLLKSILTYEDSERSLQFVCFEKAEYLKIDQLIRITIQKDFYEMITAYEKGYTILDYFEYCSLNSIYSQNLYPILRQFRTTGKVTLFKEKWEQFTKIMQFPENLKMKDIDKILHQIVKELSEEKHLFDRKRIPFRDLTFTKIKGDGRGRGGNVIGIEFSFKPEKESEEARLIQEKDKIIEQQKQDLMFKEEQILIRDEQMQQMGIGRPYAKYEGISFCNDNGETIKVGAIRENNINNIIVEFINMENRKTFTGVFDNLRHLENYLRNFNPLLD